MVSRLPLSCIRPEGRMRIETRPSPTPTGALAVVASGLLAGSGLKQDLTDERMAVIAVASGLLAESGLKQAVPKRWTGALAEVASGLLAG